MDTGVPGERDERRSWRVLLAWNLGYLFLLPLGALTVRGDDASWICYLLLGAIALAQVAFTLRVRAVGNGTDVGAADVVSMTLLGLTCAAVGAAELLDAHLMLLLVICVPQIFALTERFVLAASLSVALVLLGAGGRLLGNGTDSWVSTVAQAGFVVVVAVVVARFTLSLLRETHKRGELIEELRATRRELAAANHDSGVRAEHSRMSREIHDTLAQGFTSLLLLMEAAEAMVGRDDRVVFERLQLGQEIARENLAEARLLVTTEPGDQLTESPLETAMDRVCKQLARALSIPVEFEVRGEVRPLDANTYVLLMRSCQEALSNVRRHAAAQRVTVTLTYHPHRVQLAVHDDGHGFDPDSARGFGLSGMQARAEQVGGHLEVSSTRGAGTVLMIEAP